jgi:integrase
MMLGNRTIPLITIDGELDCFSAGYLVGLLNEGLKPSTILIHSKGIRELYLFCVEANIDLPRRMSRLEQLTVGELERLLTWVSASKGTRELYARGTFNLRWQSIRKFILWQWNFYQHRASNNAEILNHARNKEKIMIQAFDTLGKAPFKNSGKVTTGLEPELLAKFFRIIEPLPENDLNPFKSIYIKWRNYILLLTMVLGGNRRSESILLQLKDINLYGKFKYFEIIKENSFLPVWYPHKEAPSVKTLGRKVALSDNVAALFEYYITEIRPKFKGSARSTYLFISSRDGLPLSTHTPNDIIETIIKRYPEFEGKLSPHRLRNSFQDMLNDALDKSLESELGDYPLMKQAKKSTLQEYSGGWARGSAMVSKYPAGSIERRVAQLTKGLQDKALNDLMDNQ